MNDQPLNNVPPSGPPMAPPTGSPMAPPSSAPMSPPPPSAASPSSPTAPFEGTFAVPESSLRDYDEYAPSSADAPTKVSRFRRLNSQVPKEKITKEKTQKAPRKTKNSPSAVPTAFDDIVVVVPVLTSFDLLEGGYQKVIRTRIGIMAVAGVFALIAILLTSLGLTTHLHASSLHSQDVAAIQSAKSYQARLGSLTNYTSPTGKSYQGAVMQNDIAFRAPLVRLAASSATNVTKVLSDIAALAGSQVTITGIQVNPASAAGVTTTTVLSSTTLGTGVPISVGTPVTINATATSNVALNDFVLRVQNLKYLSGAYLSALTGTPPTIIGTITATIQTLPYPVPSAAAETTKTTGGSRG